MRIRTHTTESVEIVLTHAEAQWLRDQLLAIPVEQQGPTLTRLSNKLCRYLSEVEKTS